MFTKVVKGTEILVIDLVKLDPNIKYYEVNRDALSSPI